MPQITLYFINPLAFITECDRMVNNYFLLAKVNVVSVKVLGRNIVVFDKLKNLINGVESVYFDERKYLVEKGNIENITSLISDDISAADFMSSLVLRGLKFGDLHINWKLRDLFLFVVSHNENGEELFFTCITRNEHESYYLKFYKEVNKAIHVSELMSRLIKGFNLKSKNINHGKWYTKWKYGFEKEVKYTSFHWVDVWVLLRVFYLQLRCGDFHGFIPELNDEFQVWDYDNQMYEIVSPLEKRGYVSFIHQADGRVTVKHKSFQKDQEIREEHILANQVLAPADFLAYAQGLSKGVVASLPTFRRKRFDVNLESIDTGNIYGVFMEICRVNHKPFMMVQVEVEYLRSRILQEFERVEEEYDQICGYVEKYITSHLSLKMEKGYYSKLTFLKDIEYNYNS